MTRGVTAAQLRAATDSTVPAVPHEGRRGGASRHRRRGRERSGGARDAGYGSMGGPSGSPSFAARHKGALTAAALLLVAAVGAGVAIPFALRGGGGDDAEDKTAAEEAVVVTTAAPAVEATPVVEVEEEVEEEDEDEAAGLVTGELAAECVYETDGEVVVMDSRVPVWPDADNFTWVELGDGVVFRPDVEDPFWIVGPENSSARVYPFRVGKAGTYHFNLLTTSEDVAEFNDVWGRFAHGSGLRFWSATEGPHDMEDVEGGGTEWTKLFQNQAGKALGVYTVDNEGYSIASVDVLKPGETYQLELAGRSSRFEVHRLYAVRCEEETCANTGFTSSLLAEAADGALTPCVEP